MPSQLDALSPKNTKPLVPSSAIEDAAELLEISDQISNRISSDGKNKKGITSFFRNILRKGRGSTENLESMNSDSSSSVKLERKDSVTLIGDLPENVPSSPSVDRNQLGKLGPQNSGLFTPPTSPPLQRCDTGNLPPGGASSTSSDGSSNRQTDIQQLTTVASVLDPSTFSFPTTIASPTTHQRTGKGLASPKMMLKKVAAKCSPPTSRHAIKTQDKDQETALSSTPLSPRPNPAPKPVVPPPAKPATTTSSDSGNLTTAGGPIKEFDVVCKDKEASPGPSVVRRRPASPKRSVPPVPPVPPTRISAVTEGGTLPRSDLRESMRRPMPVLPSRPCDRKEKSSTSGSPPISPIPDTENSLPSSPASLAGDTVEFSSTEWSGGSVSTIDDELPKFNERIELPTVATQSRKGFLGKLSGNRKMRTLQPVPVKRAKSITESSTLPRGDKKSKKINVADISGPVMVSDMIGTRGLGNRRNTISLGSDPAFAILVASTVNQGNTTSSSSIDKNGFDEFDIPLLSPLGSLENLYESILPKPEGSMFHYYDPPTGPKLLCPNIPADGYLEPVPPLSSTAIATTSSSLTVLTSTNLPASSLLCSSNASVNIAATKSPLKTKTSFTLIDRGPNSLPKSSKDSGSSHSTQTSASSSETNSAENSGNSLPDSGQISSKNVPGAISSLKMGSNYVSSVSSSELGPHFVEPEMSEQRRVLLATQPIYEEIPNGGSEGKVKYDDDSVHIKKGRTKSKMTGLKVELPSKKINVVENCLPVQKMLADSVGTTGDRAKVSAGHPWLHQSSSAESPSPSHDSSKQTQAPTFLSMPSSMSMTSSQIMSSSYIMTTSLTSSMLPPPPPPPDHLPAPHHTTSRSASRETVSSESDAQSSCSNFSRPRPAPRQKPRRPYTGGADQYVSMNRPNTQVSLNEEKLRDVFTKLTNITFHALQDIYAQCERILSVDRLNIPNSKILKWVDFDIYGQPLHASGRCVVYNAKLKATNCPCQIMILHSRPATEMCATSHPSLLRPSAVFADTIPFSFLTPDFIKTSQLLQNSVYDSSQARCFVAVGAFDIVESLGSHLALLRETLAQDLHSYLNVILTAALQLLSAMSHCLDQGFSVTETDYNDVFLITRSDLRGKVVAFLPHQRSLDVPQGEAMCNFLERLLTDALPPADDDDIDDEADDDEEGEKIMSSPKKVVAKLHSLLESRRVECLGQVRTAVEYLLWGPTQSELLLSPSGPKPERSKSSNTAWGGASREQELYVWLEKERVTAVCRLARNVPGLGVSLTLEELYTLKFLLKSSATCLAESLRWLSR